MDLHTLLEAIDQLPLNDLNTVQHRIEERQRQERRAQAKNRITAINVAIDAFREGLTEQELQNIVDAMNTKTIRPNTPASYDWIDEEPAGEP